MWYKVPIAAYPLDLRNIFSAFASHKKISKLKDTLAKKYGYRDVYFTNCGKVAFYIILEALKEKYPAKNEVILPNYTDAGLVKVIELCGLKPVFCDNSLRNFGTESESLESYFSKDTLCILAVHMFGVPCEIEKIIASAQKQDIVVVEDFAQSFGSKIANYYVGSIAPLAFSSFNRGKNIPLYSGGVIIVNDPAYKDSIAQHYNKLGEFNNFQKIIEFMKLAALALAMKRFVYSLFYPFISNFESKSPPRNFSLKKMPRFKQKILHTLIRKADKVDKRKDYIARFFTSYLKEVDFLLVADLLYVKQTSLSRFPVIFKDLRKRKIIRKKLLKEGIIVNMMYLKTLEERYSKYKNRYAKENSYLLAHNLLALPSHYYLNDSLLAKIISIVKHGS